MRMDETDIAESFKELSRANGHLYRASHLIKNDDYQDYIEAAIEDIDNAVSKLSRLVEEDVIQDGCDEHPD